MISRPDVDIEVIDREHVVSLFSHVAASQIVKNKAVKHNTGIYLQKIPTNPINNLASFPYEIAEELGYYKIDMLACPYPYDGISSMDELHNLLDSPINWDWFLDANFVSTLFHFGGQFNKDLTIAEVVAHYTPQSILDLACLIAIKLPAKRKLIGMSWEHVRKEIWMKDSDNQPQFKKSHSVSYALVVGIDARIKAKKWMFNNRL